MVRDNHYQFSLSPETVNNDELQRSTSLIRLRCSEVVTDPFPRFCLELRSLHLC